MCVWFKPRSTIAFVCRFYQIYDIQTKPRCDSRVVTVDRGDLFEVLHRFALVGIVIHSDHRGVSFEFRDAS